MPLDNTHQHSSVSIMDSENPNTPINPNGGGGLPAGGDIGQVVTNTGPGEGDWDDAPAGSTPTLAEVLAEGNDTGENTIDLGGATISGISPDPEAPLFNISGAAGAQGATVGIFAGTGTSGSGGAVSILGGDGPVDVDGGFVSIAGGYGNEGNGNAASVSIGGSKGDGEGGSFTVSTGDADTASGENGGDITLTPGAGDGAGRNGLVFLNLPTSDPAVAGALWADSGVVTVSAG